MGPSLAILARLYMCQEDIRHWIRANTNMSFHRNPSSAVLLLGKILELRDL